MKYIKTSCITTLFLFISSCSDNQADMVEEESITESIQFGTSVADESISIAHRNNDFYIIGSTEGQIGDNNFDNTDFFVARYSNSLVNNWIVQYGGAGYDFGVDIALDSDGSVYALATTTNNIGFNEHYGKKDVVLIKYDSSGSLLWNTQIGGENDDIAKSMAIGSNGFIYVLGNTSGTITRNSDGHQTDDFGGNDAFLASFSFGGNLRWVTQFGSDEDDLAEKIFIDEDDDIYIAGRSGNSIWVLKYILDGTCGDQICLEWETKISENDGNEQGAISLDIEGNTIYVTGYAYGNFKTGDSGDHIGGRDIVIMTMNKNTGTILSRNQFGSILDDYVYDILISNGDIYLTGETKSMLGLESFGISDIWIAVFNNLNIDNSPEINQHGTSSIDSARSMTLDNFSNIYVTGYTFGDITGERESGMSIGVSDGFIIKYE